MCGIAGYYTFKGDPPSDELKEAASSLSHRGPDHEGCYVNDTVGLAHRRLSIIDTTQKADQPYFSQDGNYVIVFNGEIYNFRELAEKFEIKPTTRSDTEILLEAYIKLGDSVLQYLNGMFAFAIYNIRENRLSLYRDRLGIKPLYYSFDGSIFYFASELKALRKFSDVNKTLTQKYSSIIHFLHLGFVPAPDTLYNEIQQLRSGHFIQLDHKGVSEKEYWNLYQCIHKDTVSNETEATDRLNKLLCSSVDYRLICDVPFGTFLSGGVDSSLITAIASHSYPGKLKTFSIGFKESSHDESVYAEAVAGYLGTDHHTFYVTEKETLENIHEVIEMFDQPFADSSALPTYLISKLAASEVKMVLTGDGGDELFMGYGEHRWAARISKPFIYPFRRPAAWMLHKGSSRYKRISKLLDYRNDEDLCSHIFSQEQYLFSLSEIENMMSTGIPENYSSPSYGYPVNRRISIAERQALFDLTYYLQDDLLVKVDRASMKASLECRLPLLDFRLVEWALNLDPSLKIKGKDSKYLLKKVLYSYLPEEYFLRPKKGFAVPISKWLKGPLQHLIQEFISEEKIRSAGLIKFKYFNDILQKYKSGHYEYLYNRIWALIVLHKMLK